MPLDRDPRSPLLPFAEQALSRAAGAELVGGNRARILKDAAQNYPAWLDAIGRARSRIFFENYIVADDAVGREFAAALAERARAGVAVRVIYDWMGALGVRSHRLLASVAAAGGEVRCFNPPRLDGPFAWLTRDHRKSLSVDGQVGFVSGLCVSTKWCGDPRRGLDPWRDTGVEISGPAVADIEWAFAEVWAEIGEPLPADALGRVGGATRSAGEATGTCGPASEVNLAEGDGAGSGGDVSLRIVATVPNAATVYRLDQLIASIARESLWLTDAYFVAMPTYVQALRAAAIDGVDVRLLVPGSSDLSMVSSFSRAGYRPLLEAGIRVFEWNGPMLHAKTAVADGRWARIGSSNLNLASWISNYELDVSVEDQTFAEAMEAQFEDDLGNATEILLAGHKRVRVHTAHPHKHRRRKRLKPGGGSAGRTAAGALRIGNTVSAAFTNRRILGPAEAGLMAGIGCGLLVLSLLGLLWPLVLMVPLALLGVWAGIALLMRGAALRRSMAVQAPAARERGVDETMRP